MKDLKMYINGQFKESRSGKWIDVLNPSTEEVISRQPEGTIEDVNEALDAARAAQKAREDASAQGITDENRIKEMIKEKVEASYDTVTTQDNKERHVNKRMTDLLKNQVAALNKDTAVNTRSNMNPVIREMLGIKVKEGGNR